MLAYLKKPGRENMENTSVLEKAAAIAKDSLTKIEAPAKAQAVEAESKAAAEKAKVAEEAKKSEGIEKEKQEAKTKEDSRILAEDDTKLDETAKKRKAELIEIKRKEDETPEAKIKRVQESTQKRIDEIKSEQLAKENKTATELAALKAELEELKKPKQVEDIKAKIKREQSEQIAKFVEEDKSKPREERREMTKNALDEWYLEDPVEATKWIQRNEYRHERDLEKAEEAASKPVDTTADKKKLAKEFFDKQNISRDKLLSKFPNITPTKEMIIEAKKEAGVPLDRNLTEEEAAKVNEKLDGKSEHFRLCREITFSDPKKYLEATDGPELVMAEMEKRLGKNTDSGNTGNRKFELTQEELDAKIQAEIDRRKLVDGEGISSTNGGKKVETTQKEKSELRQKQELIAKKAGISIENLDKSIKRRETIPGASSGGAE